MLPADTFRPGPTSGRFIEATNGRQPPFINKQPVQGFSALLKGDSGSYIVLSDNGFGKRSNSSDYILSIYDILPIFELPMVVPEASVLLKSPSWVIRNITCHTLQSAKVTDY